MENLDGGLGFRATLNIDDFTVSAQAMERQIKNFSNTAVSEVGDVEDAIRRMSEKAGQYISYYLVGQGMRNLVNSIIQTRGQFQQLEIAFETMLGNQSKANALMQQMVDTAAKTPFDLLGVAEGAKQLMAYGVSAEKVNDTLVRLGNIASGLSIPLNDIVYLYGTTMVQGRLYAQDVRQFTGRGIPLVKELAEKYHKTTDEINAMVSAGKVGFKDVEEVLNKMTNAGGQFYNLMEKQSASLTGQIANLEDAWDTVLNSWGEAGQDLFAGAISGATYFVEHMDDVLRIVKAITIAYGTYKAAMALTSVAMKGHTGIAILDNAARSAKVAMMKAEAALNGTATAQIKAMTEAEKEHYATLETMLTVEERAAILKQMRIAAINSLLTAQQQEYLSNIGLTASSTGYEAAALGVMSVEQRLALSKMDLTTKSATYRAAIAQETAAKQNNQMVTLENMRLAVKEAAAKAEATRMDAIRAKSALEAAQMELHRAQTTAGVDNYVIAQKKLEAAEENAALTRKAALAAQSDFYAKKKTLEAAATNASRSASIADTAAKTAQTAATNILSVATGKLSTMFKALWATLKANPLGWLLSIAGAVYSIVTMLTSKTEKTNDVMEEFAEGTKKVNDRLDLYYAILQKSEKGSKTYKEMLEKINQICQEYNSTLLDENSTLEEQEARYYRVKKAIELTTAEKIKAKRVEEEMNKLNDKQDDNYDSFETRINHLEYGTGRKRKVTDRKSGEEYEDEITEVAENIRNMAPEVREAVRSLVESGARELSKLSGEEYTKRYNEIINQIVAGTKAGTNATDVEMRAFKSQLTEYLNNEIRDVNAFEAAIAKVDERLKNFLSPKDTSGVANSTIDAKMAFEDLDKLLTDTQKEIDTINSKKVKVDTDNTKLNELLQKLGLIKKALSDKTTALDTEEGISNRIKQLKEERSQTKINSDRYKELNKEISRLEGRLPKHTNSHSAADTAKRNQNTLTQKQLEAEQRLEEARIAVMEEGYEKRKALLALQHKQNLAQIDREEKELEEARKKANTGELTKEEKQGFEQRRSYENQRYDKSQTQIFDGELEYKRKQYELYWRWVENMGKEVADKQFSSLLQSGTSFKSYLKKQIDELQGKKEAGALTEGESNFLISLQVQYDEVRGAKSALDAFRESVSQAINRSQTLAEKLAAVADAKRKLENGESKLNADDAATAYVEYDKMDADLQKEVQDTVLKDYRNFEEQRKSIQDEYDLLRTEAQRMGDEERVRLINQGENEALSALNASMLMQSESWKNLFSDLDALTVSEIDKLVSEIQTKLNTADLKLNPSDLKAILDRLDEAKAKILDTNPFMALGSALSSVFKKQADGSKKTSKEIKTDWKNLASATQGCFDFVNDAIDGCSVLSDLIGESANESIQMLQGVAMAGIAMASAIKSAEKSSIILTAISVALQAVSWIASLFNNDKKYEKKIENLQKNIDALERSCDRLQRAFNNTYWVFNDEERAGFEENIKLIEDQIDALEKQRQTALWAWDFVRYAQLTAQIKDLNKQLSKAKEGDDMLGLYEQQLKSLREQQELLRQQIQAENSKKKTDDSKIQQWYDEIESIEEKIEDLDQQMMETFAGTSTKEAIDQFADAIVDAYCAGEDAAKALADTTREVLKKAVIDALKRQFLAKAMDDAIKYLAEAMSDGVLTDNEKEQFEYMTQKAGEIFTNALEAVGDWIKDLDGETTADPLTGAVTSMSEETGGVIAGRLNAFIINQNQQTNIMREQLLAQSSIAQNTANANNILSQIDSTLKRIETKENSLLSQGIS